MCLNLKAIHVSIWSMSFWQCLIIVLSRPQMRTCTTWVKFWSAHNCSIISYCQIEYTALQCIYNAHNTDMAQLSNTNQFTTFCAFHHHERLPIHSELTVFCSTFSAISPVIGSWHEMISSLLLLKSTMASLSWTSINTWFNMGLTR